MIGFENVIYH